MNKTKFRSITMIALAVLAAFMLSLAVAFMPHKEARADYSPTGIFSSGSGTTVSSGTQGDISYVQFAHNTENSSVYFRRDLALKWYTAAAPTSELSNPGEVAYFSLRFSFSSLSFSSYTISFESEEENISKEAKSVNSVIFRSDETGRVTVAVKNAAEQDEEDWSAEGVEVDVLSDVILTLDETDCAIGEFAVYVNGEFVGKITNIGGYYMEYFSSAATTPRTPITFTLDSFAAEEKSQTLYVKELNGQSFELEDGMIVDNAAPVLVVNEKIYAYTLGQRFSLTYQAIDVCDTSVSVSRYYAMLAEPNEEGEYTKPADSDYKTLTTSTFFMPSGDSVEEERQYVSIRISLDDGREVSDEEEQFVYLSWYAAENAVVTMGEGEEALNYILVDRDKEAPYYIGITAEEESKTNTVSAAAREAFAAFQEEVDAASEGLSAGSGAYFYLPSLRGMIASDYADYRNLSFSVYYYKQSQQEGDSASSAASLSYNSLRFEIDEPGKYVFRILASDSSGNTMKYYYDGSLVALSSSNIWEIDEIPEFSFTVGYDGATIEDPDEQSLGYRGNKYTVEEFEIIAVTGYETEYTLYRLDESLVPSAMGSLVYSDLVTNAKEYFEGDLADALVEIKTYNSEISEDDEAWDRTDNKYQWNPTSSLSFVPDEAGYYIVKLIVSEAAMPGRNATAYQVIDVRNPIDTPPDSTYWLENNIASVVLFSISGVLLILVILLAVVKPSDQTVSDVDLEKLKGKKKSEKDRR